ncbi:MAG: ferredoxin family protein [Oscillospiraceae bacterium]|nr:ferredoxin family protein [Oscillospiraceae bacterium]
MPPVIKRDLCIACGKCATICCMDVFGPVTPKEIPQVRYPEECWHCRACVMDCPVGAVSLRYPLTHTLLFQDAVSTLEKEVK